MGYFILILALIVVCVIAGIYFQRKQRNKMADDPNWVEPELGEVEEKEDINI
jgi:hypothetical protein